MVLSSPDSRPAAGPAASVLPEASLATDMVGRSCLSESDLQLLDSRRKEVRAIRKKCTLFTQPLRTLRLVGYMTLRLLQWGATDIATHWVTTSVVLPLVLLLVIADRLEGPHKWIVDEICRNGFSLVWWVGLGVLSSVGLGCGMHSGLLFLFPHIFFICSTAEKCNSTNFDCRGNSWGDVMKPGDHFECLSEGKDGAVTFVSLVLKVFPYAFMWGAGTALGELPPYAASYTAAKAHRSDQEFEELEAEIHSHPKDIVSRMKLWMLDMIQNYGSLSVLLLSCWPNVLFDLCGIVCGHFMMPFWSFFGALFVGKAVIKVLLQTAFFVFFFAAKYDQIRAHIVSSIGGMWPFSWIITAQFGSLENLERLVLYEIQRMREGVERDETVAVEAGRKIGVSHVFAAIVLLLLTFFLISCINQFAQVALKESDDAELERLEAELRKKSSRREAIQGGNSTSCSVMETRSPSNQSRVGGAAASSSARQAASSKDGYTEKQTD